MRSCFPASARAWRRVLVGAILAGLPATGFSQTLLYWDGSGSGTVGGGDGSWSGNHWSTSPTGNTYQAWNNANFDTAVFRNTAGTVFLVGSVSVGGLTFGTDSYRITHSGGENPVITLGGSAIIDSGAGTATIQATIAGTAGLTKIGSGLLLIEGTHTYTGTTYVNEGTLAIGAGGIQNVRVEVAAGAMFDISTDNERIGSIAGAGTVSLGSSILFLTDDSTTEVSGPITGTGGQLTKEGTGTLTLSGTNTYTGITELSGGTLQIGKGGSTGSLASSEIVMSAGTSLIFNRSNNSTYSGKISGNGVVTKLGAGTLTLSGTNSYDGGTHLDGGTLMVNNAQALGTSGTLFFNGGTLGYGSSVSTDFSGRFSTAAGQLYSVNTNGHAVTFATALTSSGGSLTKTGAGTLTLPVANTYTGGTFLNNGTLTLGHANALGTTGTISFGGGTLQYGSGVSTDLSGRFSAAAGQLYNIDTNGQSVTFAAGLASAGGSLNKTGAGTLTLGGANTYTGGTTVSTGTLALGASNRLADSGNIVVNTGTLSLAGFSDTVGAVSLQGDGSITGTGTLTGSSYAVESGSISADLGGTGVALTKTTSGTVTLSGANTYTGGTTVSAGTLALGANDRLADTGTLLINGGTFSLDTFSDKVGAVTLKSGSVSGSGTLTGDSYTVEAGSISAALGGSGVALTKNTSGIVTLNGANTYTGGTTVNAGTLTLGASERLADTGALLIDSGTFAMGAYSETVGAVTLRNNGTISGTGSLTGASYTVEYGTISAALGGAGVALTKTTANAVTLNGTNTYTGGTTVSAGTLTLGSSGRLPDTGALLVDGGTLAMGAVTQTMGALTLRSGTVSGTGRLTGTSYTVEQGTISVGLGGAGVALTKNTSGTITLSGVNTYTGGTIINAGTLFLSGSNRLASDGAVLVDGGTLQIGLSLQTVGPVTLRSGAISSGSDVGALTGTSYAVEDGVISAPLAGTGVALTKSTAGTVTLSGPSTYTGGTTITGGTLTLASSNRLPDSGAVVVDGGTLSLNGLDDTVGDVTLRAGSILGVGGTLTGSSYLVESGDISVALAGIGVALTKNTPGTVTLSAWNTYTGPSTINAGTLVVADGAAAPSSSFTVNGGTLKGGGQVGALTIANGGTVSPGASPGMLTAGNTTFAGGGSLLWEINNGAGSGINVTNYDLLRITGLLTINATSGNPFTISLVSLNGSNTAGPLINFDAAQSHSYTIATTTGILGFDPSKFAVNSGAFQNDLAGGAWSLSVTGNDLNLNFTPGAIPEPSTYAAIAGVSVLLLAAHRRRQKPVRSRAS